MQESATADFAVGGVSRERERLGKLVIWIATLVALLPLVLQIAHELGWTDRGLSNWRPVAYAFIGWAIALCVGLVLSRGPKGEQAIFLLPATLLTIAFVIFPTVYAVFIAFSDWNLSAVNGRSLELSTGGIEGLDGRCPPSAVLIATMTRLPSRVIALK